MIGQRPEDARLGPVTTGRYAMLTMDNLGLLIPQHQVHAVEPGLDVQRSAGDAVGWIAVAGAHSLVYCLSGDLKPIREVPTGRHICVLLDSGTGLFGVLCNQVAMLEQAVIEVLPLPECMSAPNTPLQGLVLRDERVLCVTSAQDLLGCVGDERPPVDDRRPAQLLEGRAL